MITFEETIEAREQAFRELVMTKNHEILMAEKSLQDFLDYWTQETTHKRKQVMLWEKRLETAAFDIGKRMSYWKRANFTRSDDNFPNYWSTGYDKKLGDIHKQTAYRKHLKSLGFIFTYSAGSGEVVTPPK